MAKLHDNKGTNVAEVAVVIAKNEAIVAWFAFITISFLYLRNCLKTDE